MNSKKGKTNIKKAAKKPLFNIRGLSIATTLHLQGQ